MKKIKKVLLYVVIVAVLFVISAVSYVTLALPDVGKPEDLKIAATPQRIEHGKYLVTHVAGCVDCHTQRNWAKLAAPIDTNRLGAGGEVFDDKVDFPGVAHVPNITPYHLSSWTDGELFRAITTGVKKDGSVIFPIMPWQYYSQLDREDIYDIIAYIRTLKPVTADYPATKLDFPLNIIVHTMPQKATFSKKPDPKDTLAYGKYLVQMVACRECHSQADKGNLLPGLEFAGGRAFKMEGGTVKSANITSDKETGIGNWTKEQFVARFRLYQNMILPPVKKGEFQTIMPWLVYSGMNTGDLESIYTYIHTLKPIKNTVVKFKAD